MSAGRPHLRLVTYMCPSQPVELYELLMQYLEDQVGCEATLQYESRAPGPLPDRVDPFTADTVDLAFMSSSAFVRLLDSKNEYADHLPVTPVFSHPKNKDNEMGYYADVIIHKDGCKRVKEFLDLRGCRWAYSDEESLGGSIVILSKLKEIGENASFFGDTIRSGSHLTSLQLVLEKKAEAAAVDSTCLAYHQKYLQDRGQDVQVLESIGPLPPYPLVINKRLNDDLKTRVTKALLNFSETKFWGSRAEVYGLVKFVPNSIDAYDRVKEYRNVARDLSLGIREVVDIPIPLFLPGCYIKEPGLLL